MITFIKKLISNFKLKHEKCEWCGGRLRRKDDVYYGGVNIQDTIGGRPKRTAYVCNLCYQFYHKK